MSARFSAFQLSCFFLFSLFGSFVHTRFGICVLVLVQCWLYCVCRLCEFRANLCVHTVGIVSSCEFRFVGARSFCALMYTSNSYSFMFLLMYFDLLVFFRLFDDLCRCLCALPTETSRFVWNGWRSANMNIRWPKWWWCVHGRRGMGKKNCN